MNGLIVLLAITGGCLAGDLVTLSSRRRVGSQCCGGGHILSCNQANVQLENLGTDEINLPGGMTLDFLNNVDGNRNTYRYGSNAGEAVITYNPNSNGLHGHALSADGKSFVLEFCGSNGHVWKSLDADNMPGDYALELPTNRLALEIAGGEPEMFFPSLTLEGMQPESPPLTLASAGGEPEMFFPSLSLEGMQPESPPLTLAGVEPESPPLSLSGVEYPQEHAPMEMPLAESQNELSQTAEADNTTIVTYTVKFYYTAAVAADTADMDGFLDQVIAETNTGYENSGIPLRIAKHCAEQSSIDETGKSFSDMLNAITYSNPQFATTRDGADVAALLVMASNSCGVAWLNQISGGGMFSVTAKACATGYYSFGHEIGHNIGATHDPATSTNSYFAYGHGHLIAQGTATTGARTIMAYSAAGHYTRVNYWSNPAINYPITGTPTGVVGLSNNAALLTEKRFSLALIGDESIGNCKVVTVAPPVVTTAPVTAAPPVTTLPVTAAPPVTTLPVTAAPPVTTLPVTAAPPVTVAPPTPGPILCNKISKALRPFKTLRKSGNVNACQKKCQDMFKNGCAAFNYKKKGQVCQLLKVVYKNKKSWCTGTPFKNL